MSAVSTDQSNIPVKPWTSADHCAKMDEWAGADSREMAAGSGSALSVVSDICT